MLKSKSSGVGRVDFGSGMQILAEPEMQQIAEEPWEGEGLKAGEWVQSAGKDSASILEMKASHFEILEEVFLRIVHITLEQSLIKPCAVSLRSILQETRKLLLIKKTSQECETALTSQY